MTNADVLLRDAYPLCLGGNVFGWTIGEEESFAVLDAYVSAGGNFIDTADSYSLWADGNSGGESETIIGRWMKARQNRANLVIATKVGQLDGVGASAIRASAEASLVRLQTDYIDLYYAHIDDPNLSLAETLGAFDNLVRGGKVRAVGASNYSADRLGEALSISDRDGLARYEVVQQLYNLLERDEFEGPLQDVCVAEHIACLSYFSLARGFLTGKYRPGIDAETRRGGFGWTGTWDDRARGLLAALDGVAANHGTTVAAVALAWLRAQPAVHGAVASARTVAQLRDLLPMVGLTLGNDELRLLTEAGRDRSDSTGV